MGEKGKIVTDLSGPRTVPCPCISNGDDFGFGREAATKTVARADRFEPRGHSVGQGKLQRVSSPDLD
jgi:hypothetical protein